jgi:hypothetical protein
VNLTAVAAVIAAAASVINIAVTAVLTRRSQFRQWQREEARPIAARLLALSEEAGREWHRFSRTRTARLALSPGEDDDYAARLQQEERDYLAAGRHASDKLRFELAQLELIAAPLTREAARSLAYHHMVAQLQCENRHVLGMRPVDLEGLPHDLRRLEKRLISQFRADLGVPRDPLSLTLGRYRSRRRWRSRQARTLAEIGEPSSEHGSGS